MHHLLVDKMRQSLTQQRTPAYHAEGATKLKDDAFGTSSPSSGNLVLTTATSAAKIREVR